MNREARRELVEKARRFDEKKAQQLIADRDYQALDQMVIEHLLGRQRRQSEPPRESCEKRIQDSSEASLSEPAPGLSP